MLNLAPVCNFGQDRRFRHGHADHIARAICAFVVLVCCSFLSPITEARATGGAREEANRVPNSASSALAYGLILLQVDESSDESASTQEGAKELDCLQAGEALRTFDNVSWIFTVGFSFLIYYAWLVLRPRFLSSGAKWLISPLISSILVARIVASVYNFQLTHHCGKPSEWRFAIFATTLIEHFLIALCFFGALALYRSLRARKRAAILETE